MDKEVQEEKRKLEQILPAIIYQFVNICREYAEARGEDEDKYQSGLDLEVFRICIFMSIPIELIEAIEKVNELIEELLWYQFVEKDNGVRKVRISGYRAANEQISCFSLYSLLLYNHVLDKYSDSSRADFYRTMILYPCCRKLMELSKKKRMRIIRYLKINPRSIDEQVNHKEVSDSFDVWKNELGYLEYVGYDEIDMRRNDACEGALNLKNL